MHHLKFKFTGFFKVCTQYALILRRSVASPWKSSNNTKKKPEFNSIEQRVTLNDEKIQQNRSPHSTMLK
jgi:hypothetical protein